jgi:hypothetical protein
LGRFGLGLLILAVEQMIEVGEVEESGSFVAFVKLQIDIMPCLLKTEVFNFSGYVLVKRLTC